MTPLARLVLVLPFVGGAGPSTDKPLTPVGGDPARGERIVKDRATAACLLCHSGPFPAPHQQGLIGPSLDGVG